MIRDFSLLMLGIAIQMLINWIVNKFNKKPTYWQDLTDDEMLMIYGQNHEGKKYNLGRMVQQKLKEKNA